MNPLRPFALLALTFLAVSGCQKAFGDYSVEPPAPALPRICESRAYRCSGATLERCSDDRSRWETAAQCGSPAECNLNSESCRACTPGEYHCDGSQLELCDATGVFQLDKQCISAELCRVSQEPGHLTGECLEPACTPGASSCHGPELVRCSDGGDRLIRTALCASAAICANTVAQDPAPLRCLASACLPNEFSCDGGTLKHCNADRTDWETEDCGSPGNCSAKAGACVPCSDGDYECNHGELRTCTGGAWQTVQTCDAPALCDAVSRTCREAECPMRGMTRCLESPPLSELQECLVDLTWSTIATCASPSLCDAEKRLCEPAGCGLGETRCSGDALQQCSADATGFVTTTVCAPGTCDAANGRCGSGCSAGSFRCNDVHLEECVGGLWERRAKCLTPELCDASAATPQCREPVCGGFLGERSCTSDANLNACRAGRNGWTFAQGCATPEDCDPGAPTTTPANPGERVGFGPGACYQCIPGALSCVGNALHRCRSDGAESPKIADCPSGCTADTAGARCNP